MFKKVAGRFLKNERGTIAVVLGATMVVFVTVVITLGVETASARRASMANQGALDSAALAAAAYKSRYDAANPTAKTGEDKLTDIASQAYFNNLRESGYSMIVTGDSKFLLKIIGEVVAVKSCLNSKPFFSAEPVKVCNKSAASFAGIGGSKPVEVVFAVDVSGSMVDRIGGTPKIHLVVPAIKSIIDSYSASMPVYWGYVPYKGMVNIQPYQNAIVENDSTSIDTTADPLREINGSSLVGYSASLQKYFKNPTDTWQCYYPSWPTSYISRDIYFLGAASENYLPLNSGNTQKKTFFERLMYLPLTERIDGTTVLNDDSAPVGTKKFKAYWHHDQKITFGVEHEYGKYPIKVAAPWGTACGRYTGGGGAGGGAGVGGK